MRNTHVPVGPWRGVNTNQNGVYLECFIDEAARAANKDPLEFRRAIMSKHPKHLAVLNAAAEKAGWGTPLPAGVHRASRSSWDTAAIRRPSRKFRSRRTAR
jgi:isoquinoline 1-oxidoreductase beta subunit